MKLKALLAVLLVAGLLLIPCPPTVDANSWLDDYSYRKLIPITGSAGAGTDYPRPLEVHSGSPAIEEQTDNNADTPLWSGGNVRSGQRLTISGRTVATLSFYLRKVGSPSGNITFTIRQIDDTILASEVWGDAGSLQSSSTWEEVEFTSPASINEEVRICCEYSGGDISNYIIARYQNTDVKADEYVSVYVSSWTDATTVDYAYKYTFAAGDGVVYLDDYCTDFPNDIRYTDDDGSTELDHFIELATDDPATFWIEVADNLNSNQSIYIYYGKSGADSASNGTNTFLFFDHFTGDSLDTDKWDTVGTPTITVGSSIIDVSPDAASEYIKSKTYTVNQNVAILTRSRDYKTACVYPGEFGFGTASAPVSTNCLVKIAYTTDQFCIYCSNSANEDYSSGIADDDDYHIWDLTWLSAICRLNRDGVEQGTVESYIPSASLPVVIGQAYNYYTDAGDISTDWIAVRKYVEPEPVVGTPGNEETAPAVGEITYGYIIG